MNKRNLSNVPENGLGIYIEMSIFEEEFFKEELGVHLQCREKFKTNPLTLRLYFSSRYFLRMWDLREIDVLDAHVF